MPLVVKTGYLNAKDENGQYIRNTTIAEQTTQDQVTEINTAGTANINAIEQKGVETLASIPDDYTELSGEVADLKSAFAQYTGASNKLNIDEYEKGSITDGTGENSTYRQACRARTINNTIALCDYRIGVFNDAGSNTDFWCMIVIYTAGIYSSSTTIHTGSTYTIKKGEEYRLLIGDTTRTASTSVIDLDELVGHVTIESVFSNAFPDVELTDVGKALIVKTVADGLVTEYEYKDVSDVNVDPTLSISGDAADAKATGDAVKSVTDSMIANNDGLDFWGAEGETSQSGLTVTQHGTIVTINGVYTVSKRRRFNLSGNLENSLSTPPVEWYATAKVSMENGANYRLSIKPISGSITVPSGNTNPAFNLQVYTTGGYLGLDAYVYSDRISRTVITSDGTPLGCVLLTCNKDFVFSNYKFSVELLKIDMKNETVYVDTTNGLDTNTGTKSYPLKTIGKALSSGYRKLRVAPGVYNEKIAVNGGDLEIIKTDSSESYSDQYRKKIELINGTKLTISASGTTNIYQASYTAESGSNIYKVFVSHTVTPTTQGSLSLEYNAMLIGDKPNNAGGNNKQRLYLPVLTENELSAQGTFLYDDTNHLIKFHPWNNVLDDAYYVPADSVDTIIDLTNMESVRLEDVRIVGAYNNCAYIKKSDNVTVTACEFGLCGKGMGLRLDNTNASVIDCHAFGCAVDGFNLHEYGHSVFYGCTGFYCGDDGISHHQGCTGIIDGGEWAYNGRGSGNGGGISPTFGSDIETRNVYSHDNHLGIMQEGTSGKRRTIRWSNNVVVDNDTDFYIQYYDVVAWNCVYKTKDVLNYGTLTEYNNTILT